MENKNKISNGYEDKDFNLKCAILDVARNAKRKSIDFSDSLENQIRYSLLPSYKEAKESGFTDNLIDYIKNEELFSEDEYKENVGIVLEKLCSMDEVNEKNSDYVSNISAERNLISLPLVEKYA